MAKKIGILSDTHGYIDPSLILFFESCDEIWHAGDWGNPETTLAILEPLKPLRGVSGNIDGRDIRSRFPEVLRFQIESVSVCMLHIGGYPGKYSPAFQDELRTHKPDLMVCGHSHILKVMRDAKNNLMHINPGAAGYSGFHVFSTAVRFEIDGNRFLNMEVWEKKKSGMDVEELK